MTRPALRALMVALLLGGLCAGTASADPPSGAYVDEHVTALHEIRRVLRPRGRLRFIEHVAATPDGPSPLQRLLGPAQRALGRGCRLDIVLTDALREAGFEVETIEDWALPVAAPWLRPAVVGVARVPA